MVRLLLDSLSFLLDYASLLTSVVVLSAIFILLSKSIKKHASVYYIIFGIPLLLAIIQVILMFNDVTAVNFFKMPVIGDIVKANSQMALFGFPLLIIIMYIGALNSKNQYVRKLLNIRKELSIIAGAPVLAHSFIRVSFTFPNALLYFTNHSEYLSKNDWVKNDVGVGISNFGYVLGILMVAVFLVLWITSFGPIHKKLGGKRWKKIQRWAYVLYAMLFVHSLTLHLGWLLDSDFDNDTVIKGAISIASTVLIFASYLILKLQKRQRQKHRKEYVLDN